MSEFVGRNAVANCARCGRRRQLGRNLSDLCRDCLYVEPEWPDVTKGPALIATCEGCGDNYDPDDGCQHDGHYFCPSCLTNCIECGDAIREQFALEAASDGRWS